nr:unnamed protein product [Digitaria exilis]
MKNSSASSVPACPSADAPPSSIAVEHPVVEGEAVRRREQQREQAPRRHELVHGLPGVVEHRGDHGHPALPHPCGEVGGAAGDVEADPDLSSRGGEAQDVVDEELVVVARLDPAPAVGAHVGGRERRAGPTGKASAARQRFAALGDEAVREGVVARADGVRRVGGEGREEGERGGGAEAGVRDGGRHVGEPRAGVAAERERVRGEEEEELRWQVGAVRDEAGRVDLPRDGGHLRGDGGCG